MKNKILNITKTLLVTVLLLGAASMAGAQAGVTTRGTTTLPATAGGGGASSTTSSSSTTGVILYSGPAGCSTTTTGPGGSWTAPTTTAPAGNVAAPINVSVSAQYKAGKLTLGPCPIPAGAIPSMLSVNGITDTTGLANWGTSFLQGLTTIGTAWSKPGGFPAAAKQPKLFVQAEPLVGIPGPTNLPQPAAQFSGDVGVLGSLGIVQGNGTTSLAAGYNTLYVQGVPVCLQNGSNCPAGTGGTGGTSPWASTTASDIYNTNTRTVMLGTSSAIDGSLKLYVSGKTRLGAEVDYGGTTVLSVAPGTVNFDGPGVVGGRMSINGSTGEVTIPGNLKVGGQNVCRQDGSYCPGSGGTGAVIYRLNPRCSTDGQNGKMDQGIVVLVPWCIGAGSYSGGTWWNDAGARIDDVTSGSATSYYRGNRVCGSGDRLTVAGRTFYANCGLSPTPIGHITP